MTYEFDRNKFIKKQETINWHKPPYRSDEPKVNPWKDIAHELVWAIGIVEDEPFRIKNWNQLWNVMKRYETLCRDDRD